jgi:hypothetical protein
MMFTACPGRLVSNQPFGSTCRAYSAVPKRSRHCDSECWNVAIDSPLMEDQRTAGPARNSQSVAVLQPNLRFREINVPSKLWGAHMVDHISPEFHAEIIVVLFEEHKDLRRVTERTRVLLSNASAKHIEAVARFLPEHLVPVLPRQMLRAA